MRRATAVFAAVLLLGHAALALAQERTFFGPQAYDHPAGGTSYAVNMVAVPENVSGPFTLRVQNGTGGERSRIDAAWIFLNGAPVATPDDFNPRVTEFGRTVELLPQNKLVVIIRGRPRTQLALSLSGQLVPPKVVSLAPVNATVTLGASTRLQLTIFPRQDTETVVPLETSPAGIASVPDTITVAAGQTVADVTVGATAFGQAGITARLNGSSASALVNVVPQALKVVSVVPAAPRMNVGAKSLFTVNINAVQKDPAQIALTADVPGIVQLPDFMTVPPGATSATFEALALAVGDVLVTAAANGTQASAGVHVSPEPAAVVSLTPNPLALQQGATSTDFKVVINVAQESPTEVTIVSDAPDVAGVPATVTVPAGSVSALVSVLGGTPGTANVTASVNGSTATAVVNVNPPPPVVSEIAPAALTLAKGTPGTLTLKLSRAPATMTPVKLASSAPGVASVPEFVTVAAGALSADFPVASNAEGRATISATLNDGTATAAVTITPAELAALSISPDPGSAEVGQTVGFQATGSLTDATTADFTQLVTWSSSDPAVAIVDAAGRATALAAGRTTITASFSFVPSASSESVTIRKDATLTVSLPSLSLTGPVSVLTGDVITTMVVSSQPAPAGGVSVTLTPSSPAIGVPPSVSIAAGDTASLPFGIFAFNKGTFTVQASAPGYISGSYTVTVVPRVQIASISPMSGSPGTVVTITGGTFDSIPANNNVFFAPGLIASLISATPTQLVVSVPTGAVTGTITVSTPGGSDVSAQPFIVLPPPPAPTHAHINDLNGTVNRTSSAVAPFVLGANPGDTFSLQLLGTAVNGTATVVGNRLVYTATTAGFIGADQFPYRVQKSDGTTVDGTARVRVYSQGNLNACTRNSTQAVVNGVLTLTRTVAHPCAFYAETTTRLAPTGAARAKYFVARPSNGAAPKAAVFLIAGGDLDIGIAGDATTGVPDANVGSNANFLVRTMQLFADAGYLAIAMSRPSDVPAPGVSDPAADIDLYRISVRHAVDILAILREENSDNLPIFIAGTSRGAMSVVANNLIATGVSISSPVTVPTSDPAMVFVGDPRFPSLQPSFMQRPTHVLWNTLDQCQFTPPANSQALLTSLQSAGVAAEGGSVTGGFAFANNQPNNDPICGGTSLHQFLGIEKTAATVPLGAATAITAWLDSRIVALGGDRHPDASFAALTTAPGAPLQVDLATLARDLDGDALAYALSHATTALGGGVSLSGSTVTYTPPAGVTSGTDYFVYVVTDGRGGVGAAVITVKIGG